ncbi:MAG: hypothetical protein MRJ92_00175 [Nitrospira sp.]|nr:hypothetical protein [Nitrospira sp.]
MENRELIPELKRLGIPVASHSSALDDDSFAWRSRSLPAQKRGPGTLRRAWEGKGRVAPKSTVHRMRWYMRAAKARQKRILIKKKREEGAEEAVAPLAAAEAVFAPAAPQGAEAAPGAPPVLTAPELWRTVSPEPAPVESVVSLPPVVTAAEGVATKPTQPPVVMATPPMRRQLRKKRL